MALTQVGSITDASLSGARFHHKFAQPDNRYVYLSTNTNLLVVDVVDPASPIIAASLPRFFNEMHLVTASPSHLFGELLASAGGEAGVDLGAVSIANRLSPSLAGSTIELDPSGDSSGWSTYVDPYVLGNYAIFGAPADRHGVIDVSNPAAPSLAGYLTRADVGSLRYETGQHYDATRRIWYSTDAFIMAALDASALPAVTLLDTVGVGGGVATNAAGYDTYVYLSTTGSSTVIDASNPANLVLTGTTFSSANDLLVRSGELFTVGSTLLRRYTLANPAVPVQTENIACPTSGRIAFTASGLVLVVGGIDFAVYSGLPADPAPWFVGIVN